MIVMLEMKWGVQTRRKREMKHDANQRLEWERAVLGHFRAGQEREKHERWARAERCIIIF